MSDHEEGKRTTRSEARAAERKEREEKEEATLREEQLHQIRAESTEAQTVLDLEEKKPPADLERQMHQQRQKEEEGLLEIYYYCQIVTSMGATDVEFAELLEHEVGRVEREQEITLGSLENIVEDFALRTGRGETLEPRRTTDHMRIQRRAEQELHQVREFRRQNTTREVPGANPFDIPNEMDEKEDEELEALQRENDRMAQELTNMSRARQVLQEQIAAREREMEIQAKQVAEREARRLENLRIKQQLAEQAEMLKTAQEEEKRNLEQQQRYLATLDGKPSAIATTPVPRPATISTPATIDLQNEDDEEEKFLELAREARRRKLLRQTQNVGMATESQQMAAGRNQPLAEMRREMRADIGQNSGNIRAENILIGGNQPIAIDLGKQIADGICAGLLQDRATRQDFNSRPMERLTSYPVFNADTENMNVYTYIRRFKAALGNIGQRPQLHFVPRTLEGSARNWYDRVSSQFHSFEEFERTIIARYRPSEREAAKTFDAVQRRQDESVASFYDRIDNAAEAMEIYRSLNMEQQFRHISTAFYLRLGAGLAARIQRRTPANRDDLIKIAQEEESILIEEIIEFNHPDMLHRVHKKHGDAVIDLTGHTARINAMGWQTEQQHLPQTTPRAQAPIQNPQQNDYAALLKKIQMLETSLETQLKVNVERKPKACYNCNSPDHIMTYCPEITCRTCNQKGHMSRTCPRNNHQIPATTPGVQPWRRPGAMWNRPRVNAVVEDGNQNGFPADNVHPSQDVRQQEN